jgi:hypothetical protein
MDVLVVGKAVYVLSGLGAFDRSIQLVNGVVESGAVVSPGSSAPSWKIVGQTTMKNPSRSSARLTNSKG